MTQNNDRYADFGTNRKPICDFLLVINANLPPILHRFQVMADYMSNFRFTLTPSLITYFDIRIAYVDSSKMQTVYQSRNDTLNAVQLLFTRKFIPEMT